MYERVVGSFRFRNHDNSLFGRERVAEYKFAQCDAISEVLPKQKSRKADCFPAECRKRRVFRFRAETRKMLNQGC